MLDSSRSRRTRSAGKKTSLASQQHLLRIHILGCIECIATCCKSESCANNCHMTYPESLEGVRGGIDQEGAGRCSAKKDSINFRNEPPRGW
jgi:hypothetical protein